MPSLPAIIGTLLVAYAATYIYAFIKNAVNARKTGFPSIYVPWNQNQVVWMIISVPLRDWFKQYLPDFLYNRLTLTIYGHEFHQRFIPFDKYCGAQADLKTFMLTTCGRLEMWTSNAEVVTQILARPRDFQQLDIGNWIMGVFGGNILTSDGDHWARQRKVLAPVINERVSKIVFSESVAQTQGLLEELSTRQHTEGRTQTNQLFNMVKKLAINVLSASGLGASVPWDDTADQQPKQGFKQTYIGSVKAAINAIGGPIVLPLWFLRSYPSFLPGHEFLQNLGTAKVEFPLHTKDLLGKERLRSRTEGSITKNNILSQLIQASEHPADIDRKAAPDENRAALSDEELVGNLFIFTAAGFDTTANTLAYALVLLAKHPKWQDWVLEEVDAILPTAPDEELDYATVHPKATRVMAFMLETLRLFTPLVHIAKQTKTAQTIETSTGRYWLPANTTVYVNNIALHANPDLWRGLNVLPNEKLEEQDEWDFRPSRWINPPGSSHPLFQPPKGAYVPWSAGPRVCPGQKMAQVEFTAVFLTLLRQHRIEAAALPSETRLDTEARLEATMRNSVSILTLIMKDVYDVSPDDGKGLMLAVKQRR